jgi:hypothetical protein
VIIKPQFSSHIIISQVGLPSALTLRYLAMRERVQDHTINLEYIGTKEMIVDPLMKGLPPSISEEHDANMGLLESL